MLIITSRDPGAPPVSYIKGSGGIFKDMLIHDFDMFRFILGRGCGDGLRNRKLSDRSCDRARPGDIDSSVVLNSNPSRQALPNKHQPARGLWI